MVKITLTNLTIIIATVVAISAGVALGELAAQPTDDVRINLTKQPPTPRLQQAVNKYQEVDPSARFTFLRGHVSAFSAHPKPSVPEYALQIIEDAGLPTKPVPQTKVATTTASKDAEGDKAVTKETLKGKNIGNEGSDDDYEGQPDGVPVQADKSAAETEWYEQKGRDLVKSILRSFLATHNDVFEIPRRLLAENLPNLKLEKYGVGRHFRRAMFSQHIGEKRPVLDGKTIVLFDLNWNVVVISRQIMTAKKLGLEITETIPDQLARRRALEALKLNRQTGRIIDSTLGVDPIRGILAWHVKIVNKENFNEYTVTLKGTDGSVLNISDDTALFTDAQVKRWDYQNGNRTLPSQIITTNVYTHDDNTLVHDFFYLVNDDRNDGGTGVCTVTSPDSNTTPNAYGTTTSTEYIRPTRRGDRNFTLWRPRAPKGSFGESHVYYWARKYMQWQKQALVDLGVLTLGNFNNYTKALIIVNACEAHSGRFTSNFPVSTLDDLGENLGTIILPERCREGNPNCTPAQYQAGSTIWHTYEDDGGYNTPGVIHHELNHFVLIDYFDVNNSKDCSIQKENKYFQEGGLGRTLPQMYWHNHYNIGYLPEDGNLWYHSDTTSGEAHNPDESDTFHAITDFACGTDGGDPYSWGSVVHQPMWEIYHGRKVEGAALLYMARPARDLGMIKSMYYAADLTSASDFPSRFELANKFMEFWELFSTAVPDTKEDWCEVWGHHGLDTFIDVNYCS